jgi:plastocyanin
MMKRTLSVVVGLTLSTAVLTACGGGSSSTPATPIDADVIVNSVTGNKFDKAEYTATAGAVKIALEGESSTNHTLLVTTPDNKTVGTKLAVQIGGSDAGTFDLAAGTYNLLCDVPGHDQMKATLVVG